jgi:hypothetical protein
MTHRGRGIGRTARAVGESYRPHVTSSPTVRPPAAILRAALVAGFLAVGTLAPPRAAAQEGAPAGAPAGALPFHVGETLEYRVRVARLGAIGRVTMRVDSTPPLRGTEVLLLRFAFDAKMGLVGARDRTESWLDPVRLRALRFHKHERHPLSRHDEQVEIDPDARRWTDADGVVGESPSDAPLDELSFMYVVRTLPLADGATWTLDRHFDPARSPTRVRVLGRGRVETEAGTFRTVTLELTVRDPRRYRGEGVIRLDLTDDQCRLPVRIESTMPVFGRTVMLLTAQNHPAAHHLAVEPPTTP